MSDPELEAFLQGFVEGYSSGLEVGSRENMEPWSGKATSSE